jgi:PAS domain-containing protein
MRSHSATHDNARSGSAKAIQAVAPVFSSRKWSRRSGPPQPLFDGVGRVADAGSRAAPSEPSGGREAADALYLSIGNNCSEKGSWTYPPDYIDKYQEQNRHRSVLRIKPCWCRKWFCRYCAPRMGKGLRHELQKRLSRFKCVFGITLTIDGSLYPSAEAGWRDVMNRRLIALLVRKLHERGFLNSRDYFWVVEWQRDTQQAHWHLLIDAEFVPYGEIVAIWSSFRPKSAPPLPEKITAGNYKGHRAAFGSVRFTITSRKPWIAARYATKYLVKVPEYGFPDWVLDYVGRVRRYDHSKRFFTGPNDPAENELPEESQQSLDDGDISFDPEKLERRRGFKTLRERMAQCRAKSVVVQVDRWATDDGKFEDCNPRFVATLAVPFDEILRLLDIGGDDIRAVDVTQVQLERLRAMECEYVSDDNEATEDDF